MPIDETKRYVRVRIRNPSEFRKNAMKLKGGGRSTFATKDVGRTGYTKLVVGKPKGQTRTRTQAILYSKKDFGRAGALRKAAMIPKRYPSGEPIPERLRSRIKKEARRLLKQRSQ